MSGAGHIDRAYRARFASARGRHAIMRDMTRPIAPLRHGDNATHCADCGKPLGAVIYVAGQDPLRFAVRRGRAVRNDPRGRAVCRSCRPRTDEVGSIDYWHSFACQRCGRTVRYAVGRDYRYCTYRCANAVWSKGAIERRSRHRAEHRIKRIACEACGATFTAARTDARTCSTTCRQRAHRQRDYRAEPAT